MTGLGGLRAVEARGDDEVVSLISRLTGLTEQTVAKRLEKVHGRTKVRNVFEREWPSDAATLGRLSVRVARRFGLHDELRAVTGATRNLVSRRVNSAHGRKLLKNAFWDYWPEPVPDDETDEAAVDVLEGAADADIEFTATAGDVSEEEPDTDEAAPIGVGSLLSSRYLLGRELGRGGFGTTYEAHDRLSRMDLVVKIPHQHDGEAVQRELRQAFRLLHPNICQAFPERDDATGHPFLVLQHGGESLAERLARTGEPFPLQLAVHVLLCLADALDYLHNRLVVHFDVSPANALIDDDDNVRLTDFGASSVARERLDADGLRTIVATASAMNPIYAAPEIRHGRGRSRSDQYSLALVFCSLLEGRVFREGYRPPTFPVLTESQHDAINRALRQYPEDRFDSCGEFARAIADEMGRVPTTVLEDDLNRLSLDLVHRFQRELERTERGDARLGGVVLIGRSLERFLHASLLWIASTEGYDAEEALREIDPRSSGLAKATAGRIVGTIMATEHQEHVRSVVGPLLDDLSSKSSHIWKLINIRNAIVHGERPESAMLDAARAVGQLVREQRVVARWE